MLRKGKMCFIVEGIYQEMCWEFSKMWGLYADVIKMNKCGEMNEESKFLIHKRNNVCSCRVNWKFFFIIKQSFYY